MQVLGRFDLKLQAELEVGVDDYRAVAQGITLSAR